MRRTITKIFLTYDHELLEMHLAILKMTWGIWYLLPFSVFQHVPSSGNLGALLPEWGWGIFFLLLGTSQFLAAVNRRRLLWLRANLALFSVALWTLVAVMAFYGNPYAPSGPTVIVFALSNIAIYLKVKALKNTADDLNIPQNNVLA